MRAREFVQETVPAQQVLQYVKKIHHDFHIDDTILTHPEWELKRVPLTKLHIPDPESGEDLDDPYNRVQMIDMYHVDDITQRDIENKPIVVDTDGHIIDGNHRALAARLGGMKDIPAYVPVRSVNEDIYDVLQPLNCGPFDGGCVLVAQALQQIHGGRVVVLVDADDRAQHAAVLVNGKLIDYDGAADPKEFVQQFERNERANIQGIRPIRDHDLPDAPRDAKLIPQIVQALSENFADGKIKGKSRPGRVKRAGASCKGSVTDLRARAKKYSGERAKMYHWCANMKSGKKK